MPYITRAITLRFPATAKECAKQEQTEVSNFGILSGIFLESNGYQSVYGKDHKGCWATIKSL